MANKIPFQTYVSPLAKLGILNAANAEVWLPCALGLEAVRDFNTFTALWTHV
jgi:hypothetical protein